MKLRSELSTANKNQRITPLRDYTPVWVLSTLDPNQDTQSSKEYIEKWASETPMSNKKNVIDLGQGSMFYWKNVKDYPWYEKKDVELGTL